MRHAVHISHSRGAGGPKGSYDSGAAVGKLSCHSFLFHSPGFNFEVEE